MTHRKEKLLKRSLVAIAVSVLLFGRASAQLLSPDRPEHRLLELAQDQYRAGMYANALQSAEAYIKDNAVIKSKPADEADKAYFIANASAIQLDIKGSVEDAVSFMNTTANPMYKQRVAYLIGQHYFRHDETAKAIPYYEMAGIENLSNSEIADAKFELAYCYFSTRQVDKAEPLLAAIKELDGKYAVAGNYYYGLLAYSRSNYTDALASFQRVLSDNAYKNIVPYYILEIYYFTGKKDKALSEAKQLLARNEKLFYDNELHLLTAQILFEKQRYAEALPYFEYYYQHTERIRKGDLYEMAYCYYNGKNWSSAIEKFSQISDTRDSLGQTVLYLLGDCYLNTDNKQSARNAFVMCADMPFSPGQKEAALLLASKLSYEMGYSDDALQSINELLEQYPASVHKDEAKTIKSDLLLKTNNYTEAYSELADVAVKNEAYYRVLQKVSYGYAMQKLQNGDLQGADSLLSQSLSKPVDEKYEMAANFWKGELAYKMHRYDDAIEYSERYVTKASLSNKAAIITSAANLHAAYLNMGYAAMEQKDFESAQWYFNKSQLQNADSSEILDAALREADAVFMQKGYLKAIALYDRVIAAGVAESDYAKFQKATILGVIGKRTDKSAILMGLINAVPKSLYMYDARYQQALEYIEDNKYQPAINMLMPLTEAYDKSALSSKAWMKIGFCYQQLNNDDKAIEAYRKVVTDYPNAEERPAALDALRGLYVEHNQPEAFAQLLKENNITVKDDNSVDSAYYNAAETQFASAKWAAAKQAFAQYLKQFPNGVFANKAHFYKAESHLQLNEMKDALTDYTAVLKGGWSEFAERSAAKASGIAYADKDYEAALNYYTQLRTVAMNKQNLQNAYAGLMRCNYQLKRYADAGNYADTLIALPGLDENIINEGLLYKARALKLDNKEDSMYAIYKQLAGNKKPFIAAEANYEIATVNYKNDRLKEAEEQVNIAIKQASGDDRMVVRCYLLLSDILTKQKDYFNAKALLQSIVKNSKQPELKQEASKKLEEVKALETKNSKLKQD
ncbi:MAG: tetratricopeptide repeat protein [Bacteroidetes bacterium]|nr:tetratricopeptide repeat protein [Bacteroidota bacterium]